MLGKHATHNLSGIIPLKKLTRKPRLESCKYSSPISIAMQNCKKSSLSSYTIEFQIYGEKKKKKRKPIITRGRTMVNKKTRMKKP